MPISCTICFGDVEKSSQAAAVPCGHVFDAICVTQRLQQRAVCPVCNHPCAVSDVRNIYFIRTNNNDAHEEIAYKSPNTLTLTEEIDRLKIANRLQKNEIEHLRHGLSNEQTLLAKNTQSDEVKDLKKAIAAHEKTCKEAVFEREYQKMVAKCEKLERQKDKIEIDMNVLYQKCVDYQEKKEQELDKKNRLIMECEEKHGSMKSLVDERDEAVEKCNALAKELAEKQAKKQTSSTTSKVQRRPKSGILPQPSGSQSPVKVYQPFKVLQPVKPVKPRQPVTEQQSTNIPQKPVIPQQFGMEQRTRIASQPYQKKIAPQPPQVGHNNSYMQQQSVMPQKKTYQGKQMILEPQTSVPKSSQNTTKPQTPQAKTHQRSMVSIQPGHNHYKWQVYVSPPGTSSISKKQKLDDKNPPPQASPVQQERASASKTGSHFQKISPRPLSPSHQINLPRMMSPNQTSLPQMSQPQPHPPQQMMNLPRKIIQWPGTPTLMGSKPIKRKKLL